MRELISAEEIQQAVAALGETISQDYRDRPLTILGVLTGSIIFVSDLIRSIEIPVRLGLIQASSYRGQTTESGDLRIAEVLLPDIEERDVLLVDDIFDTGKTIAGLIENIRTHHPASIRTAVLLWKKERQKVDFNPDYHCFSIPNQFVIGYGLDYNNDYRHLPGIHILDAEEL